MRLSCEKLHKNENRKVTYQPIKIQMFFIGAVVTESLKRLILCIYFLNILELTLALLSFFPSVLLVGIERFILKFGYF